MPCIPTQVILISLRLASQTFARKTDCKQSGALASGKAAGGVVSVVDKVTFPCYVLNCRGNSQLSFTFSVVSVLFLLNLYFVLGNEK